MEQVANAARMCLGGLGASGEVRPHPSIARSCIFELQAIVAHLSM
jgi:hypothetical protein